MLFKEINFEKKITETSLSLKGITHSNNWDSYYECYSYCVNVIINGGLSKGYFFNSKSRSILFLIRHSWELYLKKNINAKNLTIPLTHDFTELFPILNQPHIDYKLIENLFNKLNFEGDGACFKYYANKQKIPYFNYDKKIYLSKIIKDYESIRNNQTNVFPLTEICNNLTDDKKTEWNLTLHLGEAKQLMHIKNEYDQIIEFLLDGILTKQFDISKLYLPLLFLVRHSLEIGLKYNISEVQRMSSQIKTKDYSNEHSLATLYNCYSDFLNKIDKNKVSENVLSELKKLQDSYNSLNNIIHNLDNNSNYFRFPISEKDINQWKLTNKLMYNILKIYYFTDKFITFTNDVLEEEGLIVDENKRL